MEVIISNFENDLYILHLDTHQIENQSFFDTVKEMVVCQICHGILIDPVTCSQCECNFCFKCLKSWKLLKSNNSNFWFSYLIL